MFLKLKCKFKLKKLSKKISKIILLYADYASIYKTNITTATWLIDWNNSEKSHIFNELYNNLNRIQNNSNLKQLYICISSYLKYYRVIATEINFHDKFNEYFNFTLQIPVELLELERKFLYEQNNTIYR
jgi:hypothetical protein